MLEKKIDDDLKEALKAGEVTRVSVLRMLKAAIKNKAIEKRNETLDPSLERNRKVYPSGLEDSDIVAVLKKQIKQHKESIEAFIKGNRNDLVEKEKQELGILSFYKPPELSEEEIIKVVLRVVEDSSSKGKGDIGKVMKLVMLELKGKADGKLVNKIVTEELIKQEGGGGNGVAQES